jgi:hypothetical protein
MIEWMNEFRYEMYSENTQPVELSDLHISNNWLSID